MNEILTTLKPEGVWKEFQGITCVPRPSKKEAKMVAYLEQWAINHNVKYIKEECGNIIMSVPATKGMEDRQTIILQAHMDMVCEKNSDKVHDFENDPIEAVLKGEWLYANGTISAGATISSSCWPTPRCVSTGLTRWCGRPSCWRGRIWK